MTINIIVLWEGRCKITNIHFAYSFTLFIYLFQISIAKLETKTSNLGTDITLIINYLYEIWNIPELQWFSCHVGFIFLIFPLNLFLLWETREK